ncbi:transferase hexapeptide (six repeat-containing protein) [Bhargavaea beijingensis]|uniref:Transferase hexapeptide (Six repeat-containing protein) n=1 Tax=Bhargavaea beijingensis TaxID=426756 RepID=A0A1G6Z9L2_9BACL|nr:CatB-related O-acetyltransferase [Bhargavaea beijingensis]SDD99290.1 transferase hexapeptide (six repeat-containing protein) [Bhargavaea beijingensis]
MNIKYVISKILKKLQIPSVHKSILHTTTRLGSRTEISQSRLGKYTYIGSDCQIIHAELGNFCSIADNCIIGGASHPLNWVSTSPVFHKGKNILRKNFSEHDFNVYKKTVIGHDVWIGSNSLIKSGVSIGSGSVIGMGSVVTKDIGEYEIWAGNPAKLIRKRFDEETISILLKSEWWKEDEKTLSTKAVYFNETQKFVEETTKSYEDRTSLFK